jgi:hypothetical protein
MGFRFSRRMTLFPGVRINFSKSGISASFGPRGAGITVGPRGSAVHVGIPGTGLSFRQQLGSGRPHPDSHERPEAGRHSPAAGPPIAPDMTAIQSAPVSELTSGDLESLKALIKQVMAERNALHHAIPIAQKELATATRRLWRAENWFFGLFLKKKIPERKAAVEAKTKQLENHQERLSGAFIDADFALDEPTRAAFENVTQACQSVAGCSRIWEIVADRANDRKVTRSAATRSVDRSPVKFSICEDPVLQTGGTVLQLENTNGPDLLLYPGFIYRARLRRGVAYSGAARHD